MNRHISSRVVTVRRSHNCIWCGEVIKRGESARTHTEEFEGMICTHHMHHECESANNSMTRDERDALTDGEGAFEPYSFKRGTKEPKSP